MRGMSLVLAGALALVIGAGMQALIAADAPATTPATATAPATSAATQGATELLATDIDGLAKAADKSAKVVVTGTVAAATPSQSGKVAKITFQDAPAKGEFTAVYFQKNFAAMEKAFGGKNGAELAGKKVRITGAVKMYNGAPEIVVDSVSQVEVVK